MPAIDRRMIQTCKTRSEVGGGTIHHFCDSPVRMLILAYGTFSPFRQGSCRLSSNAFYRKRLIDCLTKLAKLLPIIAGGSDEETGWIISGWVHILRGTSCEYDLRRSLASRGLYSGAPFVVWACKKGKDQSHRFGNRSAEW